MYTCAADGFCGGTLCGNGERELAEECDDGNTVDDDGCTNDCRESVCGNGRVDPGEECDDSNQYDEDDCTNMCSVAKCGDGVRGPGELCDDGNGDDNDQCSSTCVPLICGDGLTFGEEECDDGNSDDTDDCTTTCKLPTCSDGLANGSETHTDCGGSCGGCPHGSECESDSECVSGVCAQSLCVGEFEIVAGSSHTCVLLEKPGGGFVRCWGKGGECQLGHVEDCQNIGDGMGPTPSELGNVDIGEPATLLAAGAKHTCAGLVGGNVRCWGYNPEGILGFMSGKVGEAAVGRGNVIQVVAGSEHSCVLFYGGFVRCWGDGAQGKLGYGSSEDVVIAAAKGNVPIGGAVNQLAAGDNHTCALLESGSVRCWGAGGYGQLGYGNRDNVGDSDDSPIDQDVLIGGTVKQLAAGARHTCALLTAGGVRCWGDGSRGQLGYVDTDNIGGNDNDTPEAHGLVNVGGEVRQIVAGGAHTCALLEEDGTIRCWGKGRDGQLGYGDTEDVGYNEEPVDRVAVQVDEDKDVIQLAAGGDHTCALLEGGAVRCWGLNTDGQLGYGDNDNRLEPPMEDVPYYF